MVARKRLVHTREQDLGVDGGEVAPRGQRSQGAVVHEPLYHLFPLGRVELEAGGEVASPEALRAATEDPVAGPRPGVAARQGE